MNRCRPLVVGCGILLSGAALQAQKPRVTVISGATVIDGTARPALPDAVIVIDGMRIGQIGARKAVKVPTDATVVDAQGKFVIPGLADMHHHLISGAWTGSTTRARS